MQVRRKWKWRQKYEPRAAVLCQTRFHLDSFSVSESGQVISGNKDKKQSSDERLFCQHVYPPFFGNVLSQTYIWVMFHIHTINPWLWSIPFVNTFVFIVCRVFFFLFGCFFVLFCLWKIPLLFALKVQSYSWEKLKGT